MAAILSFEKARIDDQWLLKQKTAARFGLHQKELQGWAFFSSDQDDVSVMLLHHLPENYLIGGCPALEWSAGDTLPCFSRAASHLIQTSATRNILKLRSHHAELFLGQNQFRLDPSNCRQHQVSFGPVILLHGETTLGMAYMNKDGTIMNYSQYLGLSSYPAVHGSQEPEYY